MAKYNTNFNTSLDTDSGLAIAVISLSVLIGVCCISVAFCNYCRPRNTDHENQNYPIILESLQRPGTD